MKIRVCAVVVVCLALTMTRAAGETDLKAKKVVECGWDEPDTRFIRENIARMETMPFDGLVFHVLGDASNRQTLAATDRFLRVNVTPGNVDWFATTIVDGW
jgi:hypothetical protein